uniref:Ovate family protein n=1 Tax=Caenorhabditis tropicalis TaxID=1561998 RepID=A0A1I7U835_9PELO
MDELDDFERSTEFYSRIQQLNSSIDSMEIPTTSKIRSLCKTVSPDEYLFVSPPKNPKSYCFITEMNL